MKQVLPGRFNAVSTSMPRSLRLRSATLVAALFAATVAVSATAAVRPAPDSLLAVDMNRSVVVEGIMSTWSKEISAAERASIISHLNGLRADDLLAASVAGSFEGVLKVASQGQKFNADVDSMQLTRDHSKALGDLAIDTAYTPITPKRLLDTRGVLLPGTCIGSGGVFANTEVRSYDVTTAACIPPGVTAIVGTVYASPSNPGTVVDIYADKQGGSFGAVAVEAIGQASGAFTGNTVVIPVNTANNQISIKDLGNFAHVIIDVTGYFSQVTRGNVVSSVPSGNVFSATNSNTAANSTALRGISTSTSGGGIGVYGSHAGSGYGVLGTTAGAGFGVIGTAGAGGSGVYGAGSGTGWGVYSNGNIGTNGALDFGSATRQMIQLFGGANSYGIGIQGGTQYYRVDAGSNNGQGFAWFRGGVHSDTAFDPGLGGIRVMSLSRDGQLVLPQTLQQQIRIGDSAAGGDVMGIGAQNFVTYVRVPDQGSFNIYKNGTHVISESNPGTGGEILGGFFKTGNAAVMQNATVTGTLRVVNVVQTSDRASKTDFLPINAKAILAKVAALPLTSWAYKHEGANGVRHIGPMSQDFNKAFKVGTDDKTISTVDASGIALTAIKGLSQIVKEKDAEIATLKREMAAIKKRLGM